MHPLAIVLIIAAAGAAFCWVMSLVTHEHSWTDRLWSILPVAYVWVFAGAAGFGDVRLNVMAALVTAWGVRLTLNFARKGGYSGTEDYRWAVLRGRMSRWQFELFNFFFIAFYQNAIVLLITLPALTAYENRGTPFGLADALVAALFVALLVGETVADQQQWTFHQAKRAGGPDFRPRFATTGLWRLSRHPNFFFEQAQWWVFFVLGALAAGSVLQWTVVGALLLTLLFIGSTIFTESITRSKYPEYAEYQRVTSPIIPWPPRRRAESVATLADGVRD